MRFWSRSKKQLGSGDELLSEKRAAESSTGVPSPHNLYCRNDLVRLMAGEHHRLVYSYLRRSSRLLSSQSLDLLDHCSELKTIERHALDYCDRFGMDEEQINHVEAQLAEFAREGLLVSYGELCEICRRASTTEPPPEGINTIGVITRDRPDSLRRCIDSHVENVAKHGKVVEFVVVDGTEGPEARGGITRMLNSLSVRYGVEVRYGGLDEKRAFAKALIETGDLPPDVVNFALFDTERCGQPIGANRNALLLQTAGDIALSVDDDIVCRLAVPSGARAGLTLDARGDFMEFWFYPDREAALRSADFLDVDCFTVHERLLGRNLADCALNVGAEGLFFNGVNTQQIRSLQAGRGRVLVTFTGLLGDSAMPAPLSYLLARGASRKRLTRSHHEYRSALSHRELLRASGCHCVSANAWCVTAAFGFDNRRILPPFMPVMRGEDDVFGFTLRACREDAHFGYLPTAVIHSPPEERSYPPDCLTRFASSIRMCNVMLACVNAAGMLTGVTGEDVRLQELGRKLMWLGSMPRPDFEEFLRVHLWQMGTDNIAFFEQLIREQGGEPDYWVRDVEAYVRALKNALVREDYIVPCDLLNGRSPEEARDLSQRLVFKFGQLLHYWPEVVDVAKKLREGGRRLATTV